jgi:hypothetical protein
MTSKSTIQAWYDRGANRQYTHMAVYWDSFDGEDGDYPSYIVAVDEEDARKQIRAGQDRLMEVYSYSVPIEDQIDLPRSFTYDMRTTT